MLKQLELEVFFDTQRKSLNYFFDHVDLEKTQKLIDELSNVKGALFLTGVGKSGFIAQKMTASFVSIGVRAHFLSPINALHGDLGIVGPNDVFICLSKSGESEELLNLVPFIRNREVKIISLVSNKESRLAIASDEVIELPLDQELCPYNMVPTTSTEIQLIFGDILAVALMKKKKLSLSMFALNHPGGKIGKKLSVRVEDLMLKGIKVPLCSPEDKLLDILEELSLKRCGCLVVVDRLNKLQGIFTDGDLRRAMQKYGSEVFEKTIEDLYSKNPKTIQAYQLAYEAVELMEADQKHPIMMLPVVDSENQVLGLIKMHDILQAGIH